MHIVHTPTGHDHPYEQLPEERTPRHPLADQPFTVGVVTRPAGAIAQLTLAHHLDGAPVQRAAVTLHADWQQQREHGVGAEFLDRIVRIDQDVWSAALTAPPFGRTLTYWFESGEVRTESFTVRGEAWRTVDPADAPIAMTTDRADDAGRPAPAVQRAEVLTDGVTIRRARLTFAAGADESFFGVGERFNALDQRGTILDVRVYEQYKNQGVRTYMPIPFALSSAGYGLHVDSSRWMQFDFAASDPDRWSLEADVDGATPLALRWITAGDPLAIIAHFTRITGPAALPPEWTFGLWMSSNEWNNQARVEREVQTSLDHGIQPSVVVIEAWSDETTFYIWNDAEYDPIPGADSFTYEQFRFPAGGRWPDPKGMTDWLHAHEMRLLLWQIPVLKVLERPHAQHEADRAHYEARGYGVRHADGTPYRVRPFWFRDGYLWDVTSPAERAWWLAKRAYLLDAIGIDGFKTDGGEHLWGLDTRFADGRSGAEAWNTYPQEYTAAYYEFARAKRDGITFSRAGFTGSQHAPLHWAGDENSTWAAFRHSIYAGFSAAVSGIPFWGWDFAGFSGEIPTAELYLRAAAMAVFCPVMQYHSEYNPGGAPSRDRTPWNIAARTGDERVIPIFRDLAALRERLRPYIWHEAQHTAASGEPLMRPLRLWHREADELAYLFGRDLLVVPIVEAGVTEVACWLPPGAWVDFWTGDPVGPGRVTVAASLDRIPVFARADSDVRHVGRAVTP